MDQGLIPRRYAKAIYVFASEKGKAKDVYEMMRILTRTFDENPGLQSALANPAISFSDKLALVQTAAGVQSADASVLDDVMKLLEQNRRIDLTRSIALAYLDIYREANHISVVKVTSAAPMPEATMNRLRQLVKRHVGDGEIEFSSAVDPALIGGFTVAVGNERLDASIANELKQMRLSLLR